MELPEYPDNDLTLTNARFWVKFNDTFGIGDYNAVP